MSSQSADVLMGGSRAVVPAGIRPEFRSARALAMPVILLLILSCVVTLMAIGSQMTRLAMEADASGGFRYNLLLGGQLALFVAAAVVFVAWVYRVYANLSVIQLISKPKLTPEQAAASFFIPGLNFLRPYDVLRQAWAGSSHSGSEASAVPLGWWLTFWASWGVTLLAWLFSTPGALGDNQRVAWSVVSQALWLASTILALAMIRQIDEMQKEKSQMVSDLQSRPAVPISGTRT